jgi:hypothetical protein
MGKSTAVPMQARPVLPDAAMALRFGELESEP